MAEVLPAPDRFDIATDVVVVGAGACGLVAGLRALEAGAEALVLERDEAPSGSTAMSSGFIPAPATRFQKALGVEDSPEVFAADIQAKAKGAAHGPTVATVTRRIGPALEWLADAHEIDWIVLDDFLYPGHSRHRMHAVPEKTGAALMARLEGAAGAAGLDIVTEAHVTAPLAEGARIAGVSVTRPDGAVETIGCRALVLACNGYGGDPELVARHIPEIAGAPYHGHPGNTGDAIKWGRALGAELRDLGGYQGHGSLAHPHGILITWALMTEGAIQVNAEGRRFSNEHGGYSEQAVQVRAQPGAVAWDIFDQRLHEFAMGFPDYRTAVEAGAPRVGATAAELAKATGLPPIALSATLSEVEILCSTGATDAFGRTFRPDQRLTPPYHAIRVTGALFHTQGGLVVGADARVLRRDGTTFPNLYAGGGAACGVSGNSVDGYLSGNGLLTAIALGFVAGQAAGARATGGG